MIAQSTTYRNRPVKDAKWSSNIYTLVKDAKARHRTDLSADRWGKDGFAGSDVCEIPVHESTEIHREHASNLTLERFLKEYENVSVPVVIDGIPEEENWSAVENWKLKV